MYHPLFLVGAGVIAAGIAIYEVVQNFSQYYVPHENQQYLFENPRDPSTLGPCCHCTFDVHEKHGRKTPCGHFVHYTCEAWLRKKCNISSGMHWELVCKFCSPEDENEIPKNAVTKLGPCCRCKDIVDDDNGVKIPCGHFMHKICEAALRERFSIKFEWNLACKTCLIARANESPKMIQRNKVLPISALGSCCRCNNLVEVDNGRITPCGHYIHDTCESFLFKEFPRGFEWSVVCRICLAECHKVFQKEQKKEELKPSMLEPCWLCDQTVKDNNGRQLTCGHFIHNACKTSLFKDSSFEYDINMMCKICLTKRMKETKEMMQENDGLRKRARNGRECVNCTKDIRGVSTKLECGHEFHESCWKQVKSTSTTCPKCFDISFNSWC